MAEKTGDGISKEGYLRENYRYFHLRDTSGSEHDFHFHEFAKAVLLQSGRAEYIVEQVTYTLCPGSILLVPHHAIHKAVIDQTEPYDRVILYLNRQYFERFMPTAGLMACFDRADIRGNCLLVPDEANRRDIRRTLAEYEAAEKDSEPGAEAIRDAIMLQLLLRIERVSRLAASRMPEPEGNAEATRQGSGRLEKLSQRRSYGRRAGRPGMSEPLSLHASVPGLHRHDRTCLRPTAATAGGRPAHKKRHACRSGGSSLRLRRLFLLLPSFPQRFRNTAVRTEITAGTSGQRQAISKQTCYKSFTYSPEVPLIM